MPGPVRTLAVYTTVYPGVERYLPEWHGSLRAQTDQDYQLWIGLDNMDAGVVQEAAGARLDAKWVSALPGDSPAAIRQRCLSQLIETCDGVVLVDSDDILEPRRVEQARAALATSELAACALRMADQAGNDIGVTFGLPPGMTADEVLPRNNLFGLSNSAFRSDLLRRCLPIPAASVLVDWFLATRAWLYRAALTFDPVVGMRYRQHAANTARVMRPFTPQQVARDTGRVREHFKLVTAAQPSGVHGERAEQVRAVAFDVDTFYRNIVLEPRRLQDYVEALNGLDLAPLWWSCVAHPALSSMWATTEVIDG